MSSLRITYTNSCVSSPQHCYYILYISSLVYQTITNHSMMGGTESSQKPKAVTGNNKKGTQVRPVHTLSEAHAKFPGVQSTEFPEGWMERVIPRHNKTTFKGDRYFYSPKCQFIFRSSK